MKEVTIKTGSRVCCKELGGCDRAIKKGEKAWMQIRTKLGRRSRRYLCEECYERVAR